MSFRSLAGYMLHEMQKKFLTVPYLQHTHDEKQNDSSGVPEREFYLFLNKSICNAHCIFCSRGSEQWQSKTRKEIQGFDYEAELRSIERRLQQVHPKQVFHLGGHEPSIYPTITSIVSAAKKAGFKKIIMETNGLALAENEFVCKLVDAGVTEVQLPVYGATSEVHDAITGVAGSHLLVQKAISNLKGKRIRIRLKTVLLYQNLHEMRELLSKDIKMGCSLVMPSSTTPEEYERLCPKLTSVQPEILKRIGDLYLPCVMPKRWRGAKALRRQGEGFAVLKDGRVVRQGHYGYISQEQQLQRKIFLRRCSVCSLRKKCTGIYAMYWELFGKKELYPII